MDRPSRRRRRLLRHPRRSELSPPNGPLRAPLHLLPPRNQPLDINRQHKLLHRRNKRRHLPRYPPRRRHNHAFQYPQHQQELVRQRVHDLFGTMVAHRTAVHHPRPLRITGPPSRAPDRVCGPCGRAADRVFLCDFQLHAVVDA